LATRNTQIYARRCDWCGTYFTANSSLAKTCKNSCRVALHRAKKKGGGKTLHDLSAQDLERMQQILNISEPSYNLIFSLLEQYGANVATAALSAAFLVAETLVLEMERRK
jgi:hypothetical protein